MLTSRALLYSSSTSGSDPQRIPQYGSLAAAAGNNPPSATAATTAATRVINLRIVPPLLRVSDHAERRRLGEVSGLHDEPHLGCYRTSHGPVRASAGSRPCGVGVGVRNGLNSPGPHSVSCYVRR